MGHEPSTPLELLLSHFRNTKTNGENLSVISKKDKLTTFYRSEWPTFNTDLRLVQGIMITILKPKHGYSDRVWWFGEISQRIHQIGLNFFFPYIRHPTTGTRQILIKVQQLPLADNLDIYPARSPAHFTSAPYFWTLHPKQISPVHKGKMWGYSPHNDEKLLPLLPQ